MHSQAPWWYRTRYPLLAGWAAVCFALCLPRTSGRPGIDWNTLDRGAQLLSQRHAPGGLTLYAHLPSIQIGPLTLALVRFLEVVAGGHAALVVACFGAALVLPAIAILERAVVHETDAARRRTALCCLIGGLFVVPAWMQATVVYSHPDDVLVVVATVGMLAAVARRRPAIAGAILAAAVAAKPTALVLVPLLLAFNGRARRDALAFGSLGLLAWLPFVVADPRTLLAAQPQTLVQPGSGLAVLGLAGEATPSALRLLQLVAALGLGWLAVRRGHWAAVPLIGFGVRVAIDPGDWGYYAVTVVVAALAWHVLSDSNWIPWAAMVAWLAVGAPAGLGRHLQPHVPWSAQAVLRLTVPLALVALVLCVEARRRSRSDAVPRLGLPHAEASLAQSTSG